MVIASITWLQLGHARPRVETRQSPHHSTRRPGFNWATRVRAWKLVAARLVLRRSGSLQLGHARPRVETLRLFCEQWRAISWIASIGPRASARGNLPGRSLGLSGPIALQLGHARPRVETDLVTAAAGISPRFNWATRVRAWKRHR